ncbi:hypothetical protein [Fodinicurvata sediminis]|uniref:hypothetical protein n=1 Tax=Fodinicurvata sediminis TaxID=1121832 RepID=UPI0003B5D14F|nr:hypothetical protein [Fodinicurvata sediminis]
MKLSIRDYRGVERADIDLSRIALLAGRNEQGKSCLAEAARAALHGAPIPVAGINKKDAKLLLRQGAEEGSAHIEDGKLARTVAWPKAKVTDGAEGAPRASAYAVGMAHLLDLPLKERAAALAGYIDSQPDISDLTAAMVDIGYSEKAAEKAWKAVSKESTWDKTYQNAQAHSTALKGQWEAVTGEKYGPKKAGNWKPEGLPEEPSREDLERDLEQTRARLKEAVGSQAVSEAEMKRLQEEADARSDDPAPLRQELEKIQARLQEAEGERAALPPEEGGENEVVKCPACEAELVVERVWKGETLLKPHNEETAKAGASKEVRKKRADLDGEIGNLKSRASALNQEIANAEHTAKRAEEAQQKLEELRNQGGERDESAVTNAEAEEAAARKKLEAFDGWVKANKLHGDIQRNDKLVELLAPEGLRRRKLAKGLGHLNEAMEKLANAAEWPVVRLDENLEAHYGTRPLWQASASGRWRARLVMQAALAQIDGSCALVIDEADILDFRGRNGLMALLSAAGLPALVCLTINKPALVPDLAAAKLGQSYWIEGGTAETIEQKMEQAA